MPLFEKPPSKLDQIVSGLTHKAVDSSTLSDIVRQLQALNQFFQLNKNVQQQTLPFWTVRGGTNFPLSGLMDIIVPAKNGWNFELQHLIVMDAQTAYGNEGFISVMAGVVDVSRMLTEMWFYWKSRTSTHIFSPNFAKPILFPTSAGVYSTGFVSSFIEISGQYIRSGTE